MKITRFRKIRLFASMIVVVVAAAATTTTASAQTVTATITCDNYWALYYGDATSINTYSGFSGQYPTALSLPPFTPSDNYIYVLAWGDLAVAQGFLAEIQGQFGPTLQTGVAPWMVAPTNLGGLTGPQTSQSLIAFISNLTSVGSLAWSTPSIGPPNLTFTNPIKPWPQVSGISTGAHWIWYQRPGSPCSSSTGAPFVPGCDHGEPLLFRLSVEALRPCLKVTASNRLPCCLGKDAQGNPIYAFSATVTNPASSPVPLTITGPAGTTINSYGPQKLPPGSSVVTGTFTIAGSTSLPLCLVFEITLPGIKDHTEESGSQTGRLTSSTPPTKVPLIRPKCRGSLCFKELPRC